MAPAWDYMFSQLCSLRWAVFVVSVEQEDKKNGEFCAIVSDEYTLLLLSKLCGLEHSFWARLRLWNPNIAIMATRCQFSISETIHLQFYLSLYLQWTKWPRVHCLLVIVPLATVVIGRFCPSWWVRNDHWHDLFNMIMEFARNLFLVMQLIEANYNIVTILMFPCFILSHVSEDSNPQNSKRAPI